ncbi:hypothetical protein CTEN210_02841 [Chaetoceros tenuissimus]|uniref:Leucine-rich repeat domain-containing protein n=1 Tax=Chaetoceros tenuissimus TaxID=426638 RepID=A0AAD3H0Q3_9STRA|nr:hypothetical protein CTEN210_02841 [Chaetoceros tenuissimus]
MRVATVDGLVTLFYDGSELYNERLENRFHFAREMAWRNLSEQDDPDEFFAWENPYYIPDDWESWSHLSEECKRYWKERQSWQQIFVVEGVTEIPAWTFWYCRSLRRVIFSNTVVTIESFAFYRSNVSYIKLSTSLEYIGGSAFADCQLWSVYIPPSCRVIAGQAFDENRALSIFHVPENTTLPQSVVSFRSNIFLNMFEHRDDIDWPKLINREEEFKLHKACCSFYPQMQDILRIVEEQGIGCFRKKNNVGISASCYLEKNPFSDIKERDIVRKYTLKMMEIELT